jgi:Tol biopolymer transport system component
MLRVHRRFIEFRYTASHTASGKRRRAEMLYRVAFEGTNLIKISLVIAAAMLAMCLLALVETTNTADADDSLPENGKIAFTREGRTYYIYTVNPDGSSLRRLTKDIPASPRFPAWSPDGTQIAFNGGHIWVMGADGSNPRTLTPNKLSLQGTERPRWLPDGKRVAFDHSVSEYEGPDIYTVDLDGSNLTNITNTPKKVSEYRFDFSPDGSQMCLDRYVSDPRKPQKDGLYVMNTDGSNPTRLTHSDFNYCAWSPDGTKIAYSSNHFSEHDVLDTDVYVINPDGSGKTNLTNTRATDQYPQWSPDGTKIVFSSDRHNAIPADGFESATTLPSDIYTVDADGSDVVRVTKTPSVSESLPDWQPLTPASRSMTVDPPDTGGLSLILVASALLFSMSCLLYAMVRPRM